jgi:hypothetical protein
VDQYPLGLADRLPLGTPVGIPADQLLLFGVHADDRLAVGQVLLGLLVDVAKLRVPVVQLPHPGIHRRAGQPADPGHPHATTTAQRPGGRADEQAALLLGQVRGDQLVQPTQHGVHVHAATLPARHAPTATIGQPSHAGTPNEPRINASHLVALVRAGATFRNGELNEYNHEHTGGGVCPGTRRDVIRRPAWKPT